MSTYFGHPLAGLKTRREMEHMRASDLARRIGVTTASYYRFERGERRIYLDKARAIASTLGCTVDALAHEPTPEEQVEAMHKGKASRPAPDGVANDRLDEKPARPVGRPKSAQTRIKEAIAEGYQAEAAREVPRSDVDEEIARTLADWTD